MNKYLIEILKIQSSIILPGLGALMVPSQKAGNIVFNQHLKFNDGSLARYIAEKEGIDVQESQNKVAKFVREIEAELGKGNSYDMFEFGKFFKTNDGQVDFKMFGDPSEDHTIVEEKPELLENKKAPINSPAEILADKVIEENISPESESEEKVKAKAEKAAKKDEEKKQKEDAEQAAANAKKELELAAAETKKIEAEKAAALIKKKEEAEQAANRLKEEADAIAAAAKQKKNEVEKDAAILSEKAALITSKTTGSADKAETPINKESDTSKETKIALDKQSKNSFTPAGETIAETSLVAPPVVDDVAANSPTNATVVTEEKKKRKIWPWLILLLLLIGIGIAGFFFKDQILDYFNHESHETVIDSATNVNNEPINHTIDNDTDTANNQVNTQEDSVMNETPATTEKTHSEPVVETPVVSNSSNKGVYHLIGNAFGEETNAAKYLEKMKGKGYPAKIIGRYDGLYLVSLKTYDSRQEAEKGKSTVAADASSAWVFKKP